MAQSNFQQKFEQTAKIVGHIDLPQAEQPSTTCPADEDFLAGQASTPWQSDTLRQELDRLKAEINELRTENRWQDILVLLHPVADKWPELHDAGLHSDLLRESAFVLCRVGKYEEAISTITPLTITEPENTLAWYNLGYAAYEALYSSKKNRGVISPAERRKLIDTAHKAFGRCQQLRPDSIAFFYREAMVFKDFENKPGRAIPLFEQAIANYEKLSVEEKENIHQQRPKYIRAMYHLASCFLQGQRPDRAKQLLEKVMSEDGNRNHMSPLFKHFAMAKTLHALGKPRKALDHLQTAAIRADRGENIDYVHELAARCALLLNREELATKHLNLIPVRRRRPYIRWTEADILVSAGKRQQAVQLLEKSAERDRRSRHKSLIRVARIHLTMTEYQKGFDAARRADTFCLETFGNGSHEAQFWQAACLYRLEEYDKAEKIVTELIRSSFSFPNLNKLAKLIHEKIRTTADNHGQNTFISRVK